MGFDMLIDTTGICPQENPVYSPSDRGKGNAPVEGAEKKKPVSQVPKEFGVLTYPPEGLL